MNECLAVQTGGDHNRQNCVSTGYLSGTPHEFRRVKSGSKGLSLEFAQVVFKYWFVSSAMHCYLPHRQSGKPAISLALHSRWIRVILACFSRHSRVLAILPAWAALDSY